MDTKVKDKIKGWGVLFVDDDSVILETMQELLPLLFSNVYYANNGIEGLKIFEKQKIDLVITDLTMPQMSGDLMVKEMRKTDKELKIICISGHNEKKMLDKISKFNIDIIMKPINLIQLNNSLERLALH